MPKRVDKDACLAIGHLDAPQVDRARAAERDPQHAGDHIVRVEAIERLDEIAAGAERDDPEPGAAAQAGLGALDPVHDLVDRAVAADRDHRVAAALDALPGQLGGAAARVGRHQLERHTGLPQGGLQVRAALSGGFRARPRG